MTKRAEGAFLMWAQTELPGVYGRTKHAHYHFTVGKGSKQGHSRIDKRDCRPDRDGMGGGVMTLTGGPGLPSKPEAPWTKGHSLTKRKGREGWEGEKGDNGEGTGELSR